jgi:hypothetical protein
LFNTGLLLGTKNVQESVAPCSTDPNPCNVYLWGILKDMLNINNPGTETGLAVQWEGKAFRT